MDSEDYIELPPIPPSDSEEGYDGDGASILLKVDKEDSNGGEGDDKNDLHEDCNQYERKNSVYMEDVGKEGIAAGDCKVNHVKSGLVGENGSPFVNESESVKVDISPRSLKRPRLSYSDDQPYVHVVYNHLSSESKKKLSELLQNWSEWHTQHAAKIKESTEETLESGDEIYFPALHVGEGNTSMMGLPSLLLPWGHDPIWLMKTLEEIKDVLQMVKMSCYIVRNCKYAAHMGCYKTQND